MKFIEDTDPYLVAAGGLVDDLNFARAKREGRVEKLKQGVHVVNDAGELEFLGEGEDVFAAMYELAVEAYENDLLGIDDEDDFS